MGQTTSVHWLPRTHIGCFMELTKLNSRVHWLSRTHMGCKMELYGPNNMVHILLGAYGSEDEKHTTDSRVLMTVTNI